MNTEDPRYSKALRHPLRARILARLQEVEATPTQLAQRLDASVGTVAYHVRTLASLGLIELVAETRVRGAVAHHYRARPQSELASEDELSLAMAAANGAKGATLVALDPHRWRIGSIGSFDDARALATQATLRLDAAGWQQLSEACRQLLRQADEIARASAERVAQNPQESDRAAGMVLFMFEGRTDGAAAVPESKEAVS